MDLLLLLRQRIFTQQAILALEKDHAATITAMKDKLATIQTQINQIGDGLDLAMIHAAEKVIECSDCTRGGDEWNGARRDAITWFALGEPASLCSDLRTHFYGTKNYDRWIGQRSDHAYGYGPKHGSICFRIALTPDARTRPLTEEERGACIYYLMNLERIQRGRPKDETDGR